MSIGPAGASPEARHALKAAFRRNGLVLAALLLLQAGAVGLSFVASGPWTWGLPLGLAAVQIVLVGALSMDLIKAPALNRLAAVTGFVFLAVLAALLLSDLFTRV